MLILRKIYRRTKPTVVCVVLTGSWDIVPWVESVPQSSERCAAIIGRARGWAGSKIEIATNKVPNMVCVQSKARKDASRNVHICIATSGITGHTLKESRPGTVQLLTCSSILCNACQNFSFFLCVCLWVCAV